MLRVRESVSPSATTVSYTLLKLAPAIRRACDAGHQRREFDQ